MQRSKSSYIRRIRYKYVKGYVNGSFSNSILNSAQGKKTANHAQELTSGKGTWEGGKLSCRNGAPTKGVASAAGTGSVCSRTVH